MDDAFMLGWEEWAAFPKLNIPAVKVKVDTGARTSALHAVSVEPFGPLENPQVRFILHPIPDKPEIEVVCSAPATFFFQGAIGEIHRPVQKVCEAGSRIHFSIFW